MHAKRFFIFGARLGLVAAAALSLAACDVVVNSMNNSAKAQDEWSKTYQIAPNGRLVDRIPHGASVDQTLAEIRKWLPSNSPPKGTS